jgi:hypothetical protein
LYKLIEFKRPPKPPGQLSSLPLLVSNPGASLPPTPALLTPHQPLAPPDVAEEWSEAKTDELYAAAAIPGISQPPSVQPLPMMVNV